MEDSVKVLEAMFNKAESNLDYIARKVDAECSNLTHGTQQVNAADALKRLDEIKREYAQVVAEAAAIQEAQKDALVFFQGQLVEMVTALTQLQLQTPVEGEKPEEARRLESLLGVTLPDPGQAPAAEQSQTNEQQTQPTAKQNGRLQPPAEESDAVGAGEASGSVVRRDGDECVEVSEQEFNSVSQLVRGRVKLADVNQTYRVLWQHFKTEGNTEPLNTQQMYKMGLRVTGQTGEAKLKVLKGLKLLSMTKKGEVKLL